MKKYEGTPERYMAVPKKGIDTDALNCALNRALALIVVLGAAQEDGAVRPGNHLTESYLWALQGLIEQAQIIIAGE